MIFEIYISPPPPPPPDIGASLAFEWMFEYLCRCFRLLTFLINWKRFQNSILIDFTVLAVFTSFCFCDNVTYVPNALLIITMTVHENCNEIWEIWGPPRWSSTSLACERSRVLSRPLSLIYKKSVSIMTTNRPKMGAESTAETSSKSDAPQTMDNVQHNVSIRNSRTCTFLQGRTGEWRSGTSLTNDSR
jgi:hypothetical protein